METQFMDGIAGSLNQALDSLLPQANLNENSLFVLGCSTSETAGYRIGTASSQELGILIVDTLLTRLEPYKIPLAIGCCEHLNRALVVPRQVALARRLPIVAARPSLHAGGACGTHYYEKLTDPVLVAHADGDAGMDIGLTLIGMHIKPVAVPFRCPVDRIGHATLVMVTCRPPYIGGPRAQYE